MALQRVIGLAEEVKSTYGTAIANPDFHMEVSESSIAIEGDPLKFESGLTRAQTIVRAGPYVPKVEFTGVADLKTIGHFLKGVLGSYEYTAGDVPGTDVNVHEFYGGNETELPSFTVFGHFDVFRKAVAGVVIESLSLEVSNEFIEIAVKGTGQKDTKTDGVPAPADLKTLVGIIPLAYYDVSVKFEGSTPAGVVRSLKWEVANDIKSDDAMGIGSRFISKRPQAGARTNTLELEATFVPETIDYLEKYEYGAASASTPSNCGLVTAPFEIIISACGDSTGEKLTIQFPDNLVKIEYSASGSDVMTAKLSLESLATDTVTLEDGTTEVVTDVYCKLENFIPELAEGGIIMQAP